MEIPQPEVLTITNLAPNPSFEAAGADVEVWRNLAPNPSFEAAGVDVEVWRNLLLNPAIVNATGWVGLTTTRELTQTSVYSEAIAAAPGEVFTAEIDFTAPSGGGAVSVLFAGPRPTTGGLFGELPFTTTVYTIAAGTTMRLKHTATVPAGADGVRLQLSVTSGNYPGTSVARALVLKSAVAPPYFDGSYSSDPDLTPSWTGTANASASVLKGVNIGGAAVDFNHAHNIQSAQWYSNGGKSVRHIPIRLDGRTYAEVIPTINLVVGKTYTVSVKRRIPAPHADYTGAVLIMRFYGSATPTATSSLLPNEAGVHDATLTFTVPAGTTSCAVRFYPGTTEETWWDDLTLVEGTYTGPYFDGSTSPDPDFTPSWTGTPHASESVLKGRGVGTYAPGSALTGWAYLSSRWADSGEFSARLTAKYPTRGSSYLELANHAVPNGLVRGRTYTLAASFWQPAPSGLGLNARTMRLQVGSGEVAVAYQFPDIAGTQRASLSFTVPESGNFWLRLYNGGMMGDPDVWYDSLSIVEGDYSEPYFDGNTETFKYEGQRVTPEWSGVEHASSSYFEYYALDPWTPTADWHSPEKRRYSLGADRGMLYRDGFGVPWSGLIGVNRAGNDGEVSKRYLDGVMFSTSVPSSDYSAKLDAYTYPDEFDACLGNDTLDDVEGLIVHNQEAKSFSLCYRTLQGDGLGHGEEYKLHFVYNCIAVDSGFDHVTMNEKPEAQKFSFDIFGVPQMVMGAKPTSYFSIDSRKVRKGLLDGLEKVLYGLDGSQPQLPSIDEIKAYFKL